MISPTSVISTRYNSCVMNIAYKNINYLAKGFTINHVDFMNANLLREICTTKKLTHPNIIGNYGVIVENNNVYVLLEKGDQELVQLFTNNTFDNNTDRKKLLADISNGLKYLHTNNISHCDLSLANIVVVNGIYKIIDFGNAIKGHRFNTYIPPTPYIATFDRPQHIKVDIWAVGCILYAAYFGKLPFYGIDKISQTQQISEFVTKKNIRCDDCTDTNNSDIALIHNMLEINSSKRQNIYYEQLRNNKISLVKTNKSRLKYDVPPAWKIQLVEYLIKINVEHTRYENLYLTLINSYKIKSQSFSSYLLNTVCLFWLSFKFTTNNIIYIADLKDWLRRCKYTVRLNNEKLTGILKNIMISIDWEFDDKNILDCISARGIDIHSIREDSLILYMNISTCRMGEEKNIINWSPIITVIFIIQYHAT